MSEFHRQRRFAIPVISGAVLFCVALFLAVDLYRSYLKMIQEVPREDAAHRLAMHVRDEKLGWKLVPNVTVPHELPGKFNTVYQMDENGYKRVDGNTTKPSRTIYFIGDSFAFGFGVSNRETFPNLIKEHFLKASVNVYNASVMGYGFTQMYQQFLLFKDRLLPGDLVVLAPLTEDIDRSIRSIYFPYMLAFNNAFNFDSYPYYDGNTIKSEKITKTVSHELLTLALSARWSGQFWRWINRNLYGDTTDEALMIVASMKKLTEEKGARLALVFLPLPEECESGNYSQSLTGFDYVDIMKAFPKSEAELLAIHFSNNGHWNSRGHQLAARGVLEGLLRKGYLKEKDLVSGSVLGVHGVRLF